jgi:hypothetical protein
MVQKSDALAGGSNADSAIEQQVSLSLFVQRQSEKDAQSRPCGSYDRGDPFSINVRFPNDDTVTPENRGKCIDTSQKRPIHVLSAQEIATLRMPPAAPGETIAANFHYNNKFYIARFPADGVSEVIAQKEFFNPGIPIVDQLNSITGFSAHFQQRFEFNKPGKEVVLLPQDDPTNTNKAIKIHNVIASDEAIPKEGGESFNLGRGLEGHYCLARRLIAMQEKYDETVDRQHHFVRQWRIKPFVNKHELIDGKIPTPDLLRQEYFKSALELSDNDYRSFKAGHPAIYNTLQNSCVTAGFEIYDRVNHYRNPIQNFAEGVFRRNPLLIKQMLFSRGMLYLSESMPFHGQPDLETEVKSRQPFKW